MLVHEKLIKLVKLIEVVMFMSSGSFLCTIILALARTNR